MSDSGRATTPKDDSRSSSRQSSPYRSAKSSARSGSPRSSKSSHRSESPVTSPIRSTAGSRTNDAASASEPDLPSDAEVVLACLQRNDLDGFQRVVGYRPTNEEGEAQAVPKDEAGIESVLSAPLYPKDGMMSGNNAVFFAAYLNKKDFLAYMAQFQCFQERLVRPVALLMLSFQRYAMVFHLTAHLAPQLLTDSHGTSGDTLLHIVCQRAKTPVAFVEELLSSVKAKSPPVGAFVNIQNAAGDTALHILGRTSKGKDGGNTARLLILAGASEDVPNIKGQTPRSVATNPFVRDLMGLGKGPKPRPIPTVDDQSKAEIDAFKDSSQFPDIKKIDVPPVDPQLQFMASPFITSEAKGNIFPKQKKVKKLGSEETETLVHRLFAQSIERKERWMQSKLSVITDLDQSRSKKLSGEECDATTKRLHDDELETREERKMVTVEKYLRPPPESPQLTMEDLDESTSRLGGKRALDATRKKRADLNEKYSPLKEPKKLSKDQQDGSAARLHNESSEHGKVTHQNLFGKYCQPSGSRFAGLKKLKKGDQNAMADRLSIPVKH